MNQFDLTFQQAREEFQRDLKNSYAYDALPFTDDEFEELTLRERCFWHLISNGFFSGEEFCFFSMIQTPERPEDLTHHLYHVSESPNDWFLFDSVADDDEGMKVIFHKVCALNPKYRVLPFSIKPYQTTLEDYSFDPILCRIQCCGIEIAGDGSFAELDGKMIYMKTPLLIQEIEDHAHFITEHFRFQLEDGMYMYDKDSKEIYQKVRRL